MVPYHGYARLIGVANEDSRFNMDAGIDAGHPDTYILSSAGIYYLELKTTKGRLIPSQIKWNEWFDVNIAPHTVLIKRDVAYGLEEAKDKITAWCVKRFGAGK